MRLAAPLLSRSAGLNSSVLGMLVHVGGVPYITAYVGLGPLGRHPAFDLQLSIQ